MVDRRGCDNCENHAKPSNQFAPFKRTISRRKFRSNFLLNLLLNTHRHDHTAVAVVLDAADHAGAQSVLEFEDDLLALDRRDRKSTRLNSSHVAISYAVFCLKKKKNTNIALKNRNRDAVHAQSTHQRAHLTAEQYSVPSDSRASTPGRVELACRTPRPLHRNP